MMVSDNSSDNDSSAEHPCDRPQPPGTPDKDAIYERAAENAAIVAQQDQKGTVRWPHLRSHFATYNQDITWSKAKDVEISQLDEYKAFESLSTRLASSS